MIRYLSRGVRVYASREGCPGSPPVEAYPFQGLDIETREYGAPWRMNARTAAHVMRTLGPVPSVSIAAGRYKYAGQLTPFGTPVAELVRTGGDILSSLCGNCGRRVTGCRCAFDGPGEW